MSENLVHLDDGVTVDPRRLLLGAWREIGVRSVGPGATERLDADGCEHAVYVWSGDGTATTGEGRESASAGCAFTIVKGDSVTFRAGDEGLRLFVVTLDA